MSTFRQAIIQGIQARLLAQVPGLATIAVYNGQPDIMKSEEVTTQPYPAPALFIALQGGQWRATSALERWSDDYRIRLHLVTEVFYEDHHTSPSQAAALDARWLILQQVINALSHWAGIEGVSYLYLIEEALDEARTHLIEDVLTFTTRVQDTSLAQAAAEQAVTATSSQVLRAMPDDGYPQHNP